MPDDFHDVTVVPQCVDLSPDEVLRSLSFHEIGHAAVGILAGMHCDYSELFEAEIDGDRCWTGRTVWGSFKTSHFGFAAMCAAGPVAGSRQLAEADLLSEQAAAWADSVHDRETAVVNLARAGFRITLEESGSHGEMTWRQVVTFTEALAEKYWPHITAGAESLLCSPDFKISGNSIAQAIGITNPPRAD
ncbi:hypothetical protein [Streptomyces sp. NRRL F-2664]|uniref:hypothetical protein n=1 Tax=Streptomyces sp. NRRL F-2664 TaxID=1463842 RepID=UPI00131AF6BC|nr:hypothetical protein [Streptomyces sp. NRRL F-2664]